ncbi:MAG: ferritin-like domain-containing protein [Candidatus Obscuribacterales bacterium]|nr:ferritin-like domain-containing protein [Candidatus Obscuribacterales bacterium]
MPKNLKENEEWLLSFYRTSEISGALFFGRLCKSLRPGPVQHDMSKHFADEAQHAWLWTDCISKLGGNALKLADAYQDQYLSVAGMPANVMEILALTHVFEKRVIRQYALHSRVPDLNPEISATLGKIMDDEHWHLSWVHDALLRMQPEYGKEYIEQTVKRFWEADQEVYKRTMSEHEERVRDLGMLAPETKNQD